jgi:hypothetical protein
MASFEKNEAGVLVPKLGFKGVYHGKIIRAGEVVDEWEEENLIVNQGLNSILGVYLHADTQITTWYLGIYSANYTPVATDTASNIATNSTEITTAYSNSTRPTWTPAAAASQAIDNSASPATFTFTSGTNVYGAFLISNSTKGGATGTLFSAALFASSKTVANADQLVLTYSFTAASV